MKVAWDQALSWRLRRQFVDPPCDVGAVDIAGRLCGIHAQIASAAEMAVGVRQAKPQPDDVKRGLADRSLIKTWAMRGTLHLFHSDQAASYLSLIASARSWEKPAWQRAFGASPKEVRELAEAVAKILDGAELTRDELVEKLIADKRFKGMEENLRSGWGELLKPLAWLGALCHGPNRGGKVTFTRPADLMPDWPGLPEPDEAAPVAITAYLGAYGPATPEMFDAWLTRNSLRKPTLRRWFADMGEQLTEVDVEGDKAYIPAEHADELADCEPNESVRLLGPFDQYVLGPGTRDTHILPAQHRGKVSKAAARIAPIVVLGGRIAGVWELADDDLVVSLFPGVEKPPVTALEAEAAHVAAAGRLGGLKVRMD